MRVFKFSVVGLSGFIINEVLLWFFTDFAGIFYIISGILASVVACTSNFIMNDNWTFRERKRGNFFKRLMKYYSISAGTTVIVVSVLFILTNFLGIYYLISNVFGVFAAFLWSYFSNLRWTWFVKPEGVLPLDRGSGVSVVVPTSNKEGVKDFVSGVSRALGDIKKEIILVDNLNSSVLKGLSEAKNGIVGVMHPHHPPEALPGMIRPIMDNESALVVGSRYADGSSLNFSLGNSISHRFKSLLARGLVGVKDPFSGLFFFNKEVIKGVNLHPGCCSPGLEILVRGNHGNAMEVSYSSNHAKAPAGPGIFSYLKDLVRLYWYRMNEV